MLHPSMIRASLSALVFAFVSPTLTGCGSTDPASEGGAVGQVDMALSGNSTSGTEYRLRNGVIKITGAASATILSEEHLGETSVALELKAGGYVAKLNAGWSLERSTGDGGFEPVKAVLKSPNPLAFTVGDQATTNVRFQFMAGDEVVQLGNGRVVVGFDVDDCSPGTGNVCDSDADGTPTADDCDDHDASVYPGAPEICDGKDNDCDGVLDPAGLQVAGSGFFISDAGGSTPLVSTIGNTFGFDFAVPNPTFEHVLDDFDPLCQFTPGTCPKVTLVKGSFTFDFTGPDAATFDTQGADHWTHGLIQGDGVMSVSTQDGTNFDTYIYLLPEDTEQYLYWDIRGGGTYPVDGAGYPVISSTTVSSMGSTFFDFRGSNQGNLIAANGTIAISTCE